MFTRLGPMELIILLVIVVLIFGPGRIGKIAGELGKGIKSFRDGLSDEKKEEQPKDSDGNVEPK
jgi:sec-independent protein translocase protein TatA